MEFDFVIVKIDISEAQKQLMDRLKREIREKRRRMLMKKFEEAESNFWGE